MLYQVAGTMYTAATRTTAAAAKARLECSSIPVIPLNDQLLSENFVVIYSRGYKLQSWQVDQTETILNAREGVSSFL